VLDPSFGTAGKTTVTFGGSSPSASAIVSTSDGGIIIAGDLNSKPALVRLSRDGLVDVGFGSGGVAVLDLRGTLFDVAPTADGGCLGVGITQSSSTPDRGLIVRWRRDGTLDTTFGDGGKVVTSFGQQQAQLTAIRALADGRFMVAGSSGVGGANGHTLFTVARFVPRGRPDLTFGTWGVARVSRGPTLLGVRAMAVQPDTDVLIVGAGYAYASYLMNRLVGTDTLPPVASFTELPTGFLPSRSRSSASSATRCRRSSSARSTTPSPPCARPRSPSAASPRGCIASRYAPSTLPATCNCSPSSPRGRSTPSRRRPPS
jgi:uncharacterized delta-60 repeat protein